VKLGHIFACEGARARHPQEQERLLADPVNEATMIDAALLC